MQSHNLQSINVPFARANDNYYESFITTLCPNLSHNACEPPRATIDGDYSDRDALSIPQQSRDGDECAGSSLSVAYEEALGDVTLYVILH